MPSKTLEYRGYNVSSSSGAWSNSAGSSYATVTNLQITVKVSGQAVYGTLFANEPSFDSYIGGQTDGSGNGEFKFKFQRNISGTWTDLNIIDIGFEGLLASSFVQLHPGQCNFYDNPGAGSHEYRLVATRVAGATVNVNYCKLLIYEMPFSPTA